MLLPSLLLLSMQAGTPVSTAYTESVTLPDGAVEMRARAQRLVATGKPDIWLVGAVHIGTKDYYSSVQSLLNSQDEVLYEGVKEKEDNSLSLKPSAGGPKPIYQVLSDAIGLDFQLNDIDYSRPNWKDVDLTWPQIMEMNKVEGHGKSTEVNTISSMFDPKGKMAQTFSDLIQKSTPGTREAFKILLVKLVASGKGPGLDPTATQVVVVARNKVVLDELKKELQQPNPPKSIAIFYGALHLPGIEKALTTSYGYHEADKKWFTAASADPKKLDETGRQLIAGFEKISQSPPPAVKPS